MGCLCGLLCFFSIPTKAAATIHVSWSFSGIRCMDEGLLVCKVSASSNAEKGKLFPTGRIPPAFPAAMNKDRCFFMASQFLALFSVSQQKSRLFHEEALMNRVLHKEWARLREGTEVVRQQGTGRGEAGTTPRSERTGEGVWPEPSIRGAGRKAGRSCRCEGQLQQGGSREVSWALSHLPAWANQKPTVMEPTRASWKGTD